MRWRDIFRADTEHVCPVEKSRMLDVGIRRWFQNPRKILAPYVTEGMTVLDVGCGPGFFVIDMAHLVGATGKVIAADLQEGMLEKLKHKVEGTELEKRIVLHQCEKDSIGVMEPVDFVLLFYTVHEVPNEEGLLNEMWSLLKPHGNVLIVEPKLHVSKSAFEKTIRTAQDAGFTLVERPKIRLSKAVVLKKVNEVRTSN